MLSLWSLNLHQQSTITHSCFLMGNADGILYYLQDYNVCHTNLNSTFHTQWQVWSSLHSNSNGEGPQGCMAPINSLSIQEHMCGNICATVSPSLQPYFSFHESVDKLGIFIALLVVCMARNHYISLQLCNMKKGESPLWNSSLRHSILKCRLLFYHSIILFHLPECPALVFLTTPIKAVFFVV